MPEGCIPTTERIEILRKKLQSAKQELADALNASHEAQLRGLEAERDAARAVIEKAWEATKGPWPYTREGAVKVDRLRNILSAGRSRGPYNHGKGTGGETR